MKHLTVRNIPEALARALEEEKRRRGRSLNQTVIELLELALGVRADQPFDNGLGRYAGTWSEEEFQEFERNTACFEVIDPELWQ